MRTDIHINAKDILDSLYSDWLKRYLEFLARAGKLPQKPVWAKDSHDEWRELND